SEYARQVIIYAAGLGAENRIDPQALLILPACVAIALLMPNVQTIMGAAFPGLETRGYAPLEASAPHIAPWFKWSPDRMWSLAIAALAALCLLKLNHVSDFIYFQF